MVKSEPEYLPHRFMTNVDGEERVLIGWSRGSEPPPCPREEVTNWEFHNPEVLKALAWQMRGRHQLAWVKRSDCPKVPW